MRKYAIPRPLYFAIILTLILLSFGTTYAYFSSQTVAIADMSMHKVNVAWMDMKSDVNGNDGFVESQFGSLTLNLTNKLQRGQPTHIQCVKSGESKPSEIFLGVNTSGSTTTVYCRIKLVATYINDAGATVDFSDDITPKHKYYSTGEEIRDVTAWKKDGGYYYYRSSPTAKALMTIDRNSTIRFANYLYLSEDCDADLLGRAATVSITVEAVQSSKEATKALWGYTW